MSTDLHTRDNDWDGILATGERILWQGQPLPRVSFRGGHIMETLMGVFFMGFSLFWMKMAMQAPGPFWMFGLLFFFIGLYNAFGKYFWAAFKRQHTWYTLTNQTAYIANDMPFASRSLKSYPINSDSVLEYLPGDAATIYFGSEIKKTNKSTRKLKIGFEHLEDGNKVYDLLRQIQKGAL